MNADFKGLRTAIYRVSDVKKATAWYTSVSGAEPYFNEPFYVGFNVAGYELGFQPEESEEVKGTSVLTYWGVNDVAQTYENSLVLGATEFEKPVVVVGGIIVAAVKDAWGTFSALFTIRSSNLPYILFFHFATMFISCAI
jgi:catechol 2,3-dioxygenase-like lactoylglutathione lyase family enzyme